MTQAARNTHNNLEEASRDFATAINAILQGRINSTGTFTIASGTTTTVVVNPLAHSGSIPIVVPIEAPISGLYVSARTLGSFTLTHASAGTNTDYLYTLIG